MENDAVVDNILQELRRGAIILAVLGLLKEEKYGYAILKELAEPGLDIDQGTLYPLLRRLETQGLLESKWRVDEARPRRYYVLSSQGLALLPRLKGEWLSLVDLMNKIL